jgi:hypothetical protein
MNAIAMSLAVLFFIFLGTVLGMRLRKLLPESHFNDDFYRVLTLSTGLVVTMAALVIGMLVSSAKSGYDATQNQFIQECSNIVMFDRLLASYGPEAKEARSRLRSTVQASLAHLWPDESSSAKIELAASHDIQSVYESVLALSPKDAPQILNKSEAVTMVIELRRMRWLLLVESHYNSLSLPLLMILASWLVAIFIVFGLLAPPNPTVVTALVVCALAVAGAIFIIVQMNTPFEGLLRISGEPLRMAFQQLGK